MGVFLLPFDIDVELSTVDWAGSGIYKWQRADSLVLRKLPRRSDNALG